MKVERLHIICLLILLGIVFFVVDKDPSPVVSAEEAPQIVEEEPASLPISQGKYEYLEVTDGCAHGTDELCVWAYAGPGTEYEKMYQLEKGMLLKIRDTKVVDGQTWYHIYFDEWLRHPERTNKDWYVPAVAGHVVKADGVQNATSKSTTTKRIIVDLSDQMLYAYDGDKQFMVTKVSTGERNTPTPTGTFTIYKKTPTRYMQGPLPGVTSVPFDLPGVPWNMYFTQGGAVIHGTYWHNDYGNVESSGCVNLPPDLAKLLYDWAPVGTTISVRN
jgi:lipoprotein-anchoring transpeptidase ErfK/SrfK